MVPYLPQTKNIWCAPIRHTPYPQKREMTHICPKNASFCPIFCKFLIFRGLGMCLLGARQLFAPGETTIWYSSFLRQKIFGVHPSGTPHTPYLLKKWPIFGLNHLENVPYGCAPKFFSLRSETLSIVHILYKNNHDRIKIAENRYFHQGWSLLTDLLKANRL